MPHFPPADLATTSLIESETVLLPCVIADRVVCEAAPMVPALQTMEADPLYRELADALADRAERCYAKGGQFAHGCRRANAREHLACFMRHWLSAELLRRFGVRMPDHFCNGLPLRDVA